MVLSCKISLSGLRLIPQLRSKSASVFVRQDLVDLRCKISLFVRQDLADLVLVDLDLVLVDPDLVLVDPDLVLVDLSEWLSPAVQKD